MKAQEYLDKLINDYNSYKEKAEEIKKEYIEMFPNVESNKDVGKIVSEMDDEQLFKYFKGSQVIVDLDKKIQEIASFVDTCRKIDIELDVEKLGEIDGFLNLISSYNPFSTATAIVEGEIKEKNTKEFNAKFSEFKKAIKLTSKFNIDDGGE